MDCIVGIECRRNGQSERAARGAVPDSIRHNGRKGGRRGRERGKGASEDAIAGEPPASQAERRADKSGKNGCNYCTCRQKALPLYVKNARPA